MFINKLKLNTTKHHSVTEHKEQKMKQARDMREEKKEASKRTWYMSC